MEILKKTRKIFDQKGYRFFDNGKPFNLNIIGVRSDERVAGKFDDSIMVLYRDQIRDWRVFVAPLTTDPGSFYLRKPLNPNGTLIMLEGQYTGVYKKGIHGRTWTSGGYPALEQCGDISYVRDANRDNILDIDKDNVITGNFKTNIHRAYKNKVAEFIWKWSAGCQVLQDPKDFDELMKLVDNSLLFGYPNKFSYTLLNQKDFE